MKYFQITILILYFLFLTSCSKKEDLDVLPIFNIDSLQNPEDVDLKKNFDVVIYGGTMAGIMGAVEVVKSGRSVLLINQKGGALGGMTTNGLGITDLVHSKAYGGLTREFYSSVLNYYNNSSNWNSGNFDTYEYKSKVVKDNIMTWFEPKAAKSIVQRLIKTYKIPIVSNVNLDRVNGILKNSLNAIVSIKMESGEKFRGKFFIDATYEGDLMAGAGVKYHIGRESNAVYGESLNGIQRILENNVFQIVSGIKSERHFDNLNFENGFGDKKIQAYCYRMCLTDLPKNRVKIEKPIGYDEKDYDLIFEFIKKNPGKFLYFFDIRKLPNDKTDSNNNSAISIFTRFLGKSVKHIR